MVKISVIIPVYNSEKYLERCLESVVNQTFKDIEIILINDGSIDRSEDICRIYAEKYRNIHFINQENKGVSATRNLGIEKSIGEYISFIDSDDWIDRDMYEVMYERLKKEEADIAVCNCILEKNNNASSYMSTGLGTNVVNSENIIDEILPKIINPSKDKMSLRGPCIYLYKSKILKENYIKFPTEIHIGEDFIFNLKVMLSTKKLISVENYFYHYRIYDSSSNRKYNRNSICTYEMLVRGVENTVGFIDNENIVKDIKIMKFKYINTMILNECKDGNRKPIIEKINDIGRICESFITREVYYDRHKLKLNILQNIILNLAYRKKPVLLYCIYKLYMKIK